MYILLSLRKSNIYIELKKEMLYLNIKLGYTVYLQDLMLWCIDK